MTTRKEEQEEGDRKPVSDYKLLTLPEHCLTGTITDLNVAIILESVGDKKASVIKEVRAITGLSLSEAKKLVASAPAVVKKGLTREEAEEIEKQLTDAGAKVARNEYGSFAPDPSSSGGFVHISAEERAGLTGLLEGQKVTYQLVRNVPGSKEALDQSTELVEVHPIYVHPIYQERLSLNEQLAIDLLVSSVSEANKGLVQIAEKLEKTLTEWDRSRKEA